MAAAGESEQRTIPILDNVNNAVSCFFVLDKLIDDADADPTPQKPRAKLNGWQPQQALLKLHRVPPEVWILLSIHIKFVFDT